MTVKELIEKLKTFDPDLPVYTTLYDDHFAEAQFVYQALEYPDHMKPEQIQVVRVE